MTEHPTLTPDSRIARGPDVIAADLENKMAMMRIEKSAYYTLDPIGTEIWNLLEEPAAVAEICDALLARYAVGRDQCQKDTLVFLEKAVEEGLLIVVSADAG